jgi:hypothetical protein
MRLNPWLAAIAVGLAVSTSGARAQGPVGFGGAPTPPYSPYLNLARPGGNPAVNYYGLVRPQLDMTRTVQGLQGQLQSAQQSIMAQQSADGVLTTGHPIFFMNYGGYFLNTVGGPVTPGVTGPGVTGARTSFVGPARPGYRR